MTQTSFQDGVALPLRNKARKWFSSLIPRPSKSKLSIEARQRQPSQPSKSTQPLFLSDLSPEAPLSPTPFNSILEDKPYAFYLETVTLQSNHAFYSIAGPKAVVIRQLKFKEYLKRLETIHMLPLRHNVCVRIKDENEKERFVNDSISNVTAHLLNRKDHAEVFAAAGITKSNLAAVIRKGAELSFLPGSITYLQSKHDKLTMVILLHVDQVVMPESLPKHLERECLGFVFGYYYAVSQDPNSQDFPKTEDEQNMAAQRLWKETSPVKQERFKKCVANYTNRTKILKSSTWDLFFKNELEQGRTDSITIQRLFLAHSFDRGARFSKVPVMNTIMSLSMKKSGRFRAIGKLMELAWGASKTLNKLKGDYM